MKQEFEIINATPEHFDDIHSIYSYSVLNETASWEYNAPPKSELISRFNLITDANYPYLIAFNGKKVLGFAYANLFRGREGWRFVCENSVYIDKDFRSKGIAKALMQALIKECKSRNLKTIMAVIGDSNNTASVALHKSCGFEEIGVLRGVGVKFSKPLDSVFMQLNL